MARTKIGSEKSRDTNNPSSLSAAIQSVADAQQALQLYMKERADQNLANSGLLVPMRDLKSVETKLKSYVKN